MKTYKYTESDLENATLEWLSELGYSVAFGANIAFDDIESINVVYIL